MDHAAAKTDSGRSTKFRVIFGAAVRLCIAAWLVRQLTFGSLADAPLWQAAICWVAAVFLCVHAIILFLACRLFAADE